jgi:cell wall-associated NlpC family hydrolase
MRFVYKLICSGLEIGSYTGDQQGHGVDIQDVAHGSDLDQSLMVVGDLIFFDWADYTATFDHVEMYMGSNQMIGHGGPMHGPIIKNVTTNVDMATRARVRRYI